MVTVQKIWAVIKILRSGGMNKWQIIIGIEIIAVLVILCLNIVKYAGGDAKAIATITEQNQAVNSQQDRITSVPVMTIPPTGTMPSVITPILSDKPTCLTYESMELYQSFYKGEMEAKVSKDVVNEIGRGDENFLDGRYSYELSES